MGNAFPSSPLFRKESDLNRGNGGLLEKIRQFLHRFSVDITMWITLWKLCKTLCTKEIDH